MTDHGEKAQALLPHALHYAAERCTDCCPAYYRPAVAAALEELQDRADNAYLVGQNLQQVVNNLEAEIAQLRADLDRYQTTCTQLATENEELRRGVKR